MKKNELEELLSLKVETISILNTKEMSEVKGGFLSIGNACSWDNSCARVGCSPEHPCKV
jgi:hypothetical protein